MPVLRSAGGALLAQLGIYALPLLQRLLGPLRLRDVPHRQQNQVLPASQARQEHRVHDRPTQGRGPQGSKHLNIHVQATPPCLKRESEGRGAGSGRHSS